MLNTGITDHFERKRRELGMEREDTLAGVQALLETWYPGQVRAKKLYQGVLRLVTPNASVAGELRMRQLELAGALPELGPVRVAISVGQLN